MEKVQEELQQVRETCLEYRSSALDRDSHRSRQTPKAHRKRCPTHPLQLAYALTNLPELRMIATDPFVPSIVRKKVVQAVLQDSKDVKVTEVSRRLLGEN